MTKIKSVIQFFVLTFIFTIPIYLLIGLSTIGVWLSSSVAFLLIPLTTLAPAVAAVILTKREGGWSDVKKLFLSCLSLKKIQKKAWLVPTFLLLPILYFFAAKIASVTAKTPLDPLFPLAAIPVAFLFFFIIALAEEIGNKKATLLLGIIWALWHVPVWIFISKDLLLVSSLALALISLRILIVWFFINTRKSILIAILLHAMYNVTIGAQSVHIPTASLILAFAALLVFPVLPNAKRRVQSE